jgi:hypothetical protein
MWISLNTDHEFVLVRPIWLFESLWGDYFNSVVLSSV